MNTNELLEHFTRNYAAKNDVLCRLPLNIPIETFWQNLVEHRKSKATFLPLHSASGMPFWYVLTEKMVTASEKLSEGARNNDSGFDPYKAMLTHALCEEMFFTAFLEGAQIDQPTAMEIAETDKEPSNVQEQIIRNNKNAWIFMLKHLYKPIDERLVKYLSYLLTEDMAGNSDTYRNSDRVYIPAMEAEQAVVPSAAQIPVLMNELYFFLAAQNVHPLIKAAAGHGFILAARPFADGDERLARMLSYAVLLRSGYDYFKDISLSMIISREGFGYFKTMRETLRNDNSGDLTYFMEFYLEALVHAQNALNEDNISAVLSRERELAVLPLTAIPENIDKVKHEYPRTPQQKLTAQSVPPRETPDEPKSAVSEKRTDAGWDYSLTRNEAVKKITQKVKRMKINGDPIMERVQKHLLIVLSHGHISFNSHDYTNWCGIAFSLGQSDRKVLVRKNAVSFCKDGNCLMYNIFMPMYDGVSLELPELKTRNELENYLLLLECSGRYIEYKLAAAIITALKNNQQIYDAHTWRNLFDDTNKGGELFLKRAIELGLCTRRRRQHYKSEITIAPAIFSAYYNTEDPAEMSDMAV